MVSAAYSHYRIQFVAGWLAELYSSGSKIQATAIIYYQFCGFTGVTIMSVFGVFSESIWHWKYYFYSQKAQDSCALWLNILSENFEFLSRNTSGSVASWECFGIEIA